MLAVACGGGGQEEGEKEEEEEGELFVEPNAPVVAVDLGDFFLTPEATTAEAGAVTFSASNQGDIPHELVIIKTDIPADQLPVASGKVDEDRAGEVIGEIEEFDPGLTIAGTFDLPPGSYALICNIPGHYEAGMHAEFTVSD